jgi:hypothetical protein
LDHRWPGFGPSGEYFISVFGGLTSKAKISASGNATGRASDFTTYSLFMFMQIVQNATEWSTKMADGISLSLLSTFVKKTCNHLQHTLSGFGGLVVSMLASGTRVRGFQPGRSRRIFSGVKILSMPSFGREVKPWVCSTLKNPCDYVEVGSKAKFVGHFSPELERLGALQRAPRSCSMGAPGVDGGN